MLPQNQKLIFHLIFASLIFCAILEVATPAGAGQAMPGNVDMAQMRNWMKNVLKGERSVSRFGKRYYFDDSGEQSQEGDT